MIGDGIFIAIFALVYAWIEIEIEGPAGWAKNLPTPQKAVAHLSLYHVYMVILAGLVIGGLLYYREQDYREEDSKKKKWTHWLQVGGEFIFLLIIFFLAQDFLWFVMNPSYTVLRYKESFIPWHTHWVGIPLFNYVGAAALVMLLFLMRESRKRLAVTLGTSAVCLVVLVCVSPLYHLFYRKTHAACFEGPQRNPALCGAEIPAV